MGTIREQQDKLSVAAANLDELRMSLMQQARANVMVCVSFYISHSQCRAIDKNPIKIKTFFFCCIFFFSKMEPVEFHSPELSPHGGWQDYYSPYLNVF